MRGLHDVKVWARTVLGVKRLPRPAARTVRVRECIAEAEDKMECDETQRLRMCAAEIVGVAPRLTD